MAVQTVEMTVAEAAKFLRNAAEMTARMSQNWDNFKRICADMIRGALAREQEIRLAVEGVAAMLYMASPNSCWWWSVLSEETKQKWRRAARLVRS
jgi:hypothetical protein